MRSGQPLRVPRVAIVGGVVVVLVGGGFTAQATLGGDDHKGGELISNGGFEDGSAYWWASGNAGKETVDDAASGRGKVLRVQVPAGTHQTWDSMVGQGGFSLKKNKPYVLKFSGRSSRPVTIRVTMQQEGAPYTTALDKTITLDDKRRDVVLPFTAAEKISNAALTFQLGGADTQVSVMLDGVSAKPGKKDGGDKPKPSAKPQPPVDKPTPSPEPSGSYSILPVLPSQKPTTAKPPSAPVVPPPVDKPPAAPPAGDGKGPLAGTSGLYVDPESNPAEWAAANPGDARAGRIASAIGARPIARWFGNWNGDVRADTSAYVGRAAQAGKMPVLVPYNIPGRDCGGYSGGGAAGDAAYLAWIDAFAKGIGARPAIVVVEPDAIAQVGCLPAGKSQDDRLALIRTAVQHIKAAAPNAEIYLDAGNAAWIDAATMADRLVKSGLGEARGFALNVSNDDTTAASSAYGGKINQALQAAGAKAAPFVVDTSRNGNGDRGDWCNPAGRKLGANPGAGAGGNGAPELLLWLKVPGDSDGTCGIAPKSPAGQFDPDLAIRLIDGT